MLSSVLRSPRAVQVNIGIMRVFVRLRETLAPHKELAHKPREIMTPARYGSLEQTLNFLPGQVVR